METSITLQMRNLFLSSLCRDFSSKNSKLKQTLWPRITFCCGLYGSLQRETDCSWDWLLNDCRIQIKSYQTKEQRYSHFFHMLQIVKNITRGKKKIILFHFQLHFLLYISSSASLTPETRPLHCCKTPSLCTCTSQF